MRLTFNTDPRPPAPASIPVLYSSPLDETPFPYSTDFEAEKREVVRTVTAWRGEGHLDLDRFESFIAIKNRHRATTFENAALRKYVLGGQSSIGLVADSHFPFLKAKLIRDTDQLILEGVLSLEIEYIGLWNGDRTCTLQAYKRRLDELKNPNFAVLLVGRAKSYVGSAETRRRLGLQESLNVLLRLDETDREICRGCVRGDLTKEIAAAVGLTTRSVENRRQKILELLGFERPIEIVKLFVRLEENGLVDFGF